MRQAFFMAGFTLITMLLLLAVISIGCASKAETISTQAKPTAPVQAQPIVPPSQPSSASNPTPTPVPTQKQPGPIDGKTTSLREILGSPKLYSGKDVVIEGILFNICCGENFTFKEGLDTILVWVNTQSPMPSTSKTGSKIKVLGTVKVSFNDVGIVAKEIKFQ